MPNVPKVPGVPALSSYAVNAVTLLVEDAIAILLSFDEPDWGIFLDGEQALPEANSVVSFNYKQDWSISDYPVEEGAFQSYDKVQLPFESRVRVTSGGSLQARAALLNAVDVIANSLDLYDIVTPEKIYSPVNVTHYDLNRSATNGVGMLSIDIWFIEVRVSSTTEFSNTAQPSAAGQQNSGVVQAQSAPPQIEKTITDRPTPVQ